MCFFVGAEWQPVIIFSAVRFTWCAVAAACKMSKMLFCQTWIVGSGVTVRGEGFRLVQIQHKNIGKTGKCPVEERLCIATRSHYHSLGVFRIVNDIMHKSLTSHYGAFKCS